MKTVGIYDAKNRLSELVAEVEAGESILLTRNGRPVAQLVAPSASKNAAQQASQWLLSRKWKLNGISLRDLINEGRHS